MTTILLTNHIDTNGTNTNDKTTLHTASNNPFKFGYDGGMGLAPAELTITQITFPYSFYSINTNNSTFQIDENGTTLSIVMTSGNYNTSSFTTMLKTVLEAESVANGASLIYTISINADTGKLTISTTANIELLLANYPKSARVLGYTVVNTVGVATSITGSYPVQLLYSKIFFCCPEIASHINSRLNTASPASGDIILCIPLHGTEPYTTQVYDRNYQVSLDVVSYHLQH